MELYDKNLNFLKNYVPGLYNVVNEDPIFNTTLEDVDGDEFNMFMSYNNDKCYMHSVYSVEREMNAIFKDFDSKTELVVLFGMGCGYPVLYINEHFPNVTNLIIVEPSLEIFKAMLKKIDFFDFVNLVENITFIVNKDIEKCTGMLMNVFKTYPFKAANFISILSYRTLFNNYYEELQKILYINLRELNINLKTRFTNIYTWIANSIKNLKFDLFPLEPFLKHLKGIPAIIVSAGPSLDNEIELLKKVGNKALIIAAGSAIKILDSHGIIPHFRVSVDGYPEEYLVFKNIDTKVSPLISSSSIYNKILPEYKGKKIRMVISVDFIMSYIYKKMNFESTVIPSGFSVSNSITAMLAMSGCRKIIFLGQDLCYTKNKIYASGSWRDDNKILPNTLVKVKDKLGNDVYTTRPLLGIKEQIVNAIEYFHSISIKDKIEFINATKEGLLIEHTKQMDFKDVLADLKEEYNFNEIIHNVFNYDSNFYKTYKNNLNNSIKILESENNIIYNDCIKTLDLAKTLRIELEDKRIFEFWSLNQKIETEFENIVKHEIFIDVYKDILIEAFEAIKLAAKYEGDDELKKMQSVEEILIGKLSLLTNVCILIKTLFNELNTGTLLIDY